MGYHCKSGVVIGVLVNSSEVKLGAEAEELLDRMFNEPHEGELYVYRYTPDLDTTTWVARSRRPPSV